MPATPRNSATIAALFVGLIAGCHRTPKASDHYDLNGTQGTVAVVPNDSVILDVPSVKVDKGIITISGTVHRQASMTGELAGRVDIEFLGPEGQYLDGLPALLTPRTVPADPNASASYSTSYGYVPPAGSTVRVHFVDRETQIQEDLSGNDYGYGGGHGRAGAGGSRESNGNTTHTAGGHSGGGHGGTHW